MPNTIAQNLQRLVTAKSAISEAITAKGGTISTGDGFEDFPADIATIPSGGGSGDASKPVRFIDYDGSIVASYTPEEFAELTSLPANPSHDGLTAQGWNWSLTDATAYVAKYGFIDIGQMYITDDGRTRLYVRMREGRLSPILKLYLNANSLLDIDWGDGSAHDTFSTTDGGFVSKQHNYSASGDYVVSIGVTRGSFDLRSSKSDGISTLFTAGDNLQYSRDNGYLNMIRKVELGCGIPSIGRRAFRYCYSLKTITIPSNVTGDIENATFSTCYSLKHLTIPNGITNIKDYACHELRTLCSIAIPNSVESIDDLAFSNNNMLIRFAIPDSVTRLTGGLFGGCYSLEHIVIPDSVTIIESLYNSGSPFEQCISLENIVIPDSVTRLGKYAVGSNYVLTNITIPNSVTSIGAYVFSGDRSLGFIKFEGTTPPTVENSNAWSYLPTDCKILVPRGSLSAYTSATNYPSSSTYTYEEYDV